MEMLVGPIVAIVIMWLLFVAMCNLIGLKKLPGKLLKKPKAFVEDSIVWILQAPFRLIGWLFKLIFRNRPHP